MLADEKEPPCDDATFSHWPWQDLRVCRYGGARPARAACPAASCPTDGTPMEFIPKKPADANPVQDDLAKYECVRTAG